MAGRDNAATAVAWPVYYPSCRWARAFGAAPIHLGERGYRKELDADGDGIACEPYRNGISTSERA
ncbi:excalibur calcium-binding domain-containing protein [Sphingomonadaceae bacterium OTU29LAMAA1]|nr:excalibur calcium-binding domain-containing protein [Sphingomonadaceae bacterium OTU29LAMAA1]